MEAETLVSDGGFKELQVTSPSSQVLAWDEPVIFVQEHVYGDRSAEPVAPSDAQAFFRRGVLRELAGYGAVMLGSSAIGGIFWWVWPDILVVRNFGVVLAVGGIVRFIFASSSALEAWLNVPPVKGGRVEVLADRIRRTDHDGRTQEWLFADIKFIQLERVDFGRTKQRQMVIRFPRAIRHEIALPDTVTFEDIEAVLADRRVPIRRPRRLVNRRFGR